MTSTERATYLYSMSSSLCALAGLPTGQQAATAAAINAAIVALANKTAELAKNIS